VEAVDVLPTLLECAGIPVPGCLQGRSFLPLLENRATVERTAALTEGEGWKTLRTDAFRYVVQTNGREALYDLHQDPRGYRDVINDPASTPTLAQMRHHLLRRLLESERPRRRTWAY
jgi:arylsulfatase A-like enzyme